MSESKNFDLAEVCAEKPQIQPRTVYYPELWYSTHTRGAGREISFRYAQEHVEADRRNMRLLFLCFPEAYIPRTHFHTHYDETTSKIVTAFTQSSEFSFFEHSRFITTSTRPNHDAYTDSERVVGRISTVHWLFSDDATSIRAAIQHLESKSVDSLKEAKSNVETFSSIAPQIRSLTEGDAAAFREIVKESVYKEIPFFHEYFALELFRRLSDKNLSEVLWRETNSIYLLTGRPHLDYFTYFNPTYESDRYRFLNEGTDRLLYSPLSIFTFIQIFLPSKLLVKFIRENENSVFGSLQSSPRMIELQAFRDAYYEMVLEISKQTWILRQADALRRTHLLNEVDVGDLFRAYLNGTLEESLKEIMSTLTKGAQVASIGQDWIVRCAMLILQTLSAPIQNSAKAAALRAKHPRLVNFMLLLKAILEAPNGGRL